MFVDPSNYTDSSNDWDVGVSYQPGYVYFNPATGQIRYLSLNHPYIGAVLQTLNPAGNLRMSADGQEGMGDWLNDVNTSITGLDVGAVSLLNAWNKIGKANRQTTAYHIQQTLKLHGSRVQTRTIKANITKGLKGAGKITGVAGVVITGVQATNDIIEGEYYSAGARVAVWGAAAGAAAIPVVGWGLAIGIGVADVIWGEQFYNWVETTMKY
jgi:hypothetical protein